LTARELHAAARSEAPSLRQKVLGACSKERKPVILEGLLREELRSADPTRAAWAESFLKASRLLPAESRAVALEAASQLIPGSLKEALEKLAPLFEEARDAESSIAVLAAALGEWQALPLSRQDEEWRGLLQRTAEMEAYEPSSLWKGLQSGIRFLREGKPAVGDPLAALAAALVEGPRFWMDDDRIAVDALRRMAAGPQPHGAAFLLDLEQALGVDDEQERNVVLTAGLEWLAAHPPGLAGLGALAVEVSRNTRDQTPDMLAASLACRRIAADAAETALRHQATFLHRVAELRTENQKERRNAVFEGLEGLNARPGSPASHLGALGGRAIRRFEQAGLDQVQAARLLLEELRLQADDMGKPGEAGVFACVESLLNTPLAGDRDRKALAGAVADAFEGSRFDPGWPGLVLGSALERLSEEAVARLTRVFLDGLEKAAEAWGDGQLTPPLVAEARAGADLKELCRKLGELHGEAFEVAALARPAGRSRIEERDEMVIVGGVPIRKNSTQE
ncbi:MAG: hypothetical protein AB1758_36035, partial [Candidatus Eremiobacterota bacterium]